jgi:hypothetical protein
MEDVMSAVVDELIAAAADAPMTPLRIDLDALVAKAIREVGVTDMKRINAAGIPIYDVIRQRVIELAPPGRNIVMYQRPRNKGRAEDVRGTGDTRAA